MNLLPFFRNRTNQYLEDALIAHADALVAGTLDREALLSQVDHVMRSQLEALMDIAERVQRSMTVVSPSEQFVKQLAHDLAIGADVEEQTLLDRIRYLPPAVQLAAAGIGGVTLTAGIVLIASRSMPDALEFWRSRRTA